MKKVKIMLMAICLFAVAGGALAFKAKFHRNVCFAATTTFNEQPTCTKPEDGTPVDCTSGIVQTDVGTGTGVCYTITTASSCPQTCPNIGVSAVEP